MKEELDFWQIAPLEFEKILAQVEDQTRKTTAEEARQDERKRYIALLKSPKLQSILEKGLRIDTKTARIAQQAIKEFVEGKVEG